MGSDDPSLFHTDLNNEYIQIHKYLGFSIQELYQISLNGVKMAFIDDSRKKELTDTFNREYNRIIDVG